MGLNGEGARAVVGVRAVVPDVLGALRLCVDTDVGLRTVTFALLFIFARGRAPGVGEGLLGRVLIGEGGRERS